MAASEPEAGVPVLSQSENKKLMGCCIVICILWVVNIGLTAWNVSSYYVVLKMHWSCWHCFSGYFMILTISVECLTFLLLIVTIPLVVLRRARGIRIYVTGLFLAIWLELNLAVILSQEYQAIGDVTRMWKYESSLTFFELNYKCCGVLGSGDYAVIGRSPPDSCYKEGSGRIEDLYTKGCSTVTMKPTPMTESVIISLICKFLMVLALVIYMIFLKQTNTPKRSWNWRHPPIRIDSRAWSPPRISWGNP